MLQWALKHIKHKRFLKHQERVRIFHSRTNKDDIEREYLNRSCKGGKTVQDT